MEQFLRAVLFLTLSTAVILSFSGCQAEQGLPIGIQYYGNSPPKYEQFTLNLDARGTLNGISFEGKSISNSNYPISYIGSWTLFSLANKENWFLARSENIGDSVIVTATCSRVVFDFYDYELYQDAGNVEFSLNGKTLGKVALKRQDSSGNKILNHVIVCDSNNLSTVKMTLLSGRVVIVGYLLVYK